VEEVTTPRPLAEGDERARFDCGRESLNGWFQRHAWRNHVIGVSRVNVICDLATNSVVGFVALSAAQIQREYLAKPQRRNKPEEVPVTLLGQFAIDRRYHGKGYGGLLLQFALSTALRASREIASLGVLTHPLDDSVRAFHRRWGFQELAEDPRRSMIVRMVDLERSGLEG
jgi:GNAT superfamily N-acetyltransferase